jgi:alpha-galactosidase
VHADVVDPAVAVHGVVAQDRGDALFAIAMTGRSTATALPRVALPGLDPDALYDVRPQAPGDAVDHAPAWWAGEGVRLPGRLLSEVGLEAPLQLPERMALVRATRV